LELLKAPAGSAAATATAAAAPAKQAAKAKVDTGASWLREEYAMNHEMQEEENLSDAGSGGEAMSDSD